MPYFILSILSILKSTFACELVWMQYVSKLVLLKRVFLFLVYHLHDFCVQKLYFNRRSRDERMKCRITFRKRRIFLRGLRKEIFCAEKRRIQRVDELSLKISTVVEIAPRASRALACCSSSSSWNVKLWWTAVPPLLLFRSDLPHSDRIYVSRHSNPLFVVVVMSLFASLPTSILPTRHLSIPRQRPHEILRVDDAIPLRLPPRSLLYCISCYTIPCHFCIASLLCLRLSGLYRPHFPA